MQVQMHQNIVLHSKCARDNMLLGGVGHGVFTAHIFPLFPYYPPIPLTNS